ncbi:MAG TPA: PH domain-containing protein [Dehalococcoidia bacterium]
MLLKGQGLTIERPSRTAGTAIGTALFSLSLVLAIALLARALSWPASWPGFLAYLGAAVLAALAIAFGFWAWACSSLRYVLDHQGLSVRWGPVTHFLPMSSITAVTPGTPAMRPQIGGIGWWGYHIGSGEVEGVGPVVFFSTHRSAHELVYVRTATVAYGLSPQDPERFAAEIERFQAASDGPGTATATIHREQIAAHPIWADRIAQYLALAAIAINVALWGYLLAVYPDLNNEITIEFPPIGDVTTLQERSEILRIPATASIILGVNLLAGLIFEWKDRAATYMVLSATLVFQVLFFIGAAIAVVNA